MYSKVCSYGNFPPADRGLYTRPGIGHKRYYRMPPSCFSTSLFKGRGQVFSGDCQNPSGRTRGVWLGCEINIYIERKNNNIGRTPQDDIMIGKLNTRLNTWLWWGPYLKGLFVTSYMYKLWRVGVPCALTCGYAIQTQTPTQTTRKHQNCKVISSEARLAKSC